MKILVAGGEGYLGSVVCNFLCEDHSVVSLDLGWFKTKLDPRVEAQTGDIFQLCHLEGFDAVIFLAGLSNDPMADFDPQGSFSQNTGSLFHLAKVAKRSGCPRFICASSCSIYGWQDREVSEDDVALAETYYGVSKYLGEIAVNKLVDANFSICTFRMGTLSGHSSRMRFDLIINTMFRSIRKRNVITVHDPEIWRPLLDVRDAARAYKFAVESAVPLNGIYNLAYGNYRVGEIASMMQELTNCEIVITNKNDVRNYRVNTSKIRSESFEFSYSPRDTALDLLSRSYPDMDSDCYFNINAYRRMHEKK